MLRDSFGCQGGDGRILFLKGFLGITNRDSFQFREFFKIVRGILGIFSDNKLIRFNIIL